MAIFGFQLVTTLIGASILSKVVTCFSFSRFLYNGLIRFVSPSDEALMEATGNCKVKYKGKKRRPETNNSFNGTAASDVFYFPRTVSLPLQTAAISVSDASKLPLYNSCQWLVDFAVCSMGVYSITELVQSSYFRAWFGSYLPQSSAEPFAPSKSNVSLSTLISLNTRFNLSLLWLGLTLYFTLRTLVSITSIYFRSETSKVKPELNSQVASRSDEDSSTTSEWFLVLAAGFIFLLIAGFSLALDGRYFDFGLQAAYSNLTIDHQNQSSSPLISWGAFHLILASVCAFIGSLLVYPGMKFGRIYMDCVKRSPVSFVQRVLFHWAFLCPLIPILLWVKPVTDHLSRSLIGLRFNPNISQGSPILLFLVTVVSEWLSVHLNSLRLLTAILVVLFRLLTTRMSIQAYLNSAQDRINQFSREPGRTSNREVQRLVSSIFYCLNLVVLQYLAPTILLLVTICLYKSCSGFYWFPPLAHPTPFTMANDPSVSTDTVGTLLEDGPATVAATSWFGMLAEMRFAFHQFASVLSVRGLAISRGVLGFLTWWCLLTVQLVSLLGLAYHSFTSN